jgi:hypothetical protein
MTTTECGEKCVADQHPDVGRRDEVPGRAHYVRAEDPSFVQGTFDLRVGRTIWHPQGQGPFRSRVLLRLHGTKPRDDIHRLATLRLRDALIVESTPGYCGVHERPLRQFQPDSHTSSRCVARAARLDVPRLSIDGRHNRATRSMRHGSVEGVFNA